jgi:hypothetical protein
MPAHLADSHPGWELTTTTDTREVLAAKIKLGENEDRRLETNIAVGPSRAEKRSASSLPGTPRHHRVARTTRTSVTLDHNDLGGGDDDNTDADFIP